MTLFGEIKVECMQIKAIFLNKEIPKEKVHAVPFIEDVFFMQLTDIYLN